MQYPERQPRPRLEDRPHTVHHSGLRPGELPAYFEHLVTESVYASSHEQSTARASHTPADNSTTAPLNIGRRMSRDDTAADVSAALYSSEWSHPSQMKAPADDLAFYPRGRPDLIDEEVALQPHPDREEVVFGGYALRGLDDPRRAYALRACTALAREQSMDERSRQAASLSRRVSRSYKDKITELKESMNKRAPRMRRASTPQNVLANPNALAERQVINGQVLPLSPSKRNARYPDPRVKKFRTALGIVNNISSGDRKDTPAPNSSVASRPAPRPLPTQHSGEEAARRAAAATRTMAHDDLTDAWLSAAEDAELDLQYRRGRVGSLSSAADSGADLSRIDYQSCKDSVGDPDEDDMDEFMEYEMADDEPVGIDFVTSRRLPTEICLQVFEYLDAIDLERAKHLGGEWADLCGRTSVWRTAYMRKWGRQVHTDPAPVLVGGAGVGRPNKPDQQWREMYKARTELDKNWRRGATEAGKAVYLSGHTDSVYCVQFDEEKIITGSRDRTIRVWDINTFQCIRVIGGPNVKPSLGPKVLRTVDYPAFHLATASVNGTAYGNNIYHTPDQWHDASILCLQYDKEILVTGSSDSDLLVWSIRDYTPIKRLKKHTGGVLDVALDAKHIVSCSKDSRIIVWDRQTLEYKGELTGHRGPVNAVQLRGKFLVSASGDGIARMWDIEAMKLVKEFGQKERGLAAVEFAEDMRHVLAGGNDNITYKFEVESGLEVMQFTGHSQLVRSLWLDSANARVVSGSYDLDLRVYDFDTGAEIWRAEEWTTSWMLAAKSDYRRIVATSQDGRILVVDFGLRKTGLDDGQPIENVDLLRGADSTSEIKWRRVNWK
ncbi:hypothetical protein LTR53_010522 [Teratosphaeriaceae sp. CCFEE 6253]|nr:hypothetical protein LTR53_010522 [Teratosphaeriaceae sp. CCFEE 6253]